MLRKGDVMKLGFLRPLGERPGPWASVYLDATRADEHGDHEVDLRWRALREDLLGRGADEATVDAIGDAVREHPYQPGRYGLAVLASGGEIALAETLPAPPAADEASYGPLPYAMPLIVQRAADVPYVRVLADRTGADLEGLSVGGAPRRSQVRGSETFPLHKVHSGGWSHRRYLQAVEEAWRRNADDVVAAAVTLAEDVGAEVIVVGGDVRAVQLFTDRLPRWWQDRVVGTDAGSRHAGADEEPLDDVTIQAVAEVADRHVREIIDRYEAQRGADSGSTGLSDVATHLQRGQVDTVLLVHDPSSTDTLWIAPDDPTVVAVDDQVLRESGLHDLQQVRADSALIRAIAATDAALVLVQPGEAKLEHGIGAVLRYADAGAAAS
jgi:hypothetical protein